MALVLLNYATGQTSELIVPAQDEKIIRVERVIITTWSGLKFWLMSDPGGGKETELTAPLQVVLGSGGIYDFTGPFAVQTGRGEALGLSTVFQGAPSEHSLMIWYELVD